MLMALQLLVSAGIILGLWGVALVPAYFVVRKVGSEHIGAEGYLPESPPSWIDRKEEGEHDKSLSSV
jgi:hypothetical protein